MKKKFTAYWWFVDWRAISFGFHVHLGLPNIEIHLPFGFIRIGWEENYVPSNWEEIKHREFTFWG